MPRQDIAFLPKDNDLREDVHMLGVLVGEVIRERMDSLPAPQTIVGTMLSVWLRVERSSMFP